MEKYKDIANDFTDDICCLMRNKYLLSSADVRNFGVHHNAKILYKHTKKAIYPDRKLNAIRANNIKKYYKYLGTYYDSREIKEYYKQGKNIVWCIVYDKGINKSPSLVIKGTITNE